MNTFIMMWNPAISNWKMEDFELTLCHFDDVDFSALWRRKYRHRDERYLFF